ncbi:MAG: dephospho-CoA kinase [Pseudomonadota bacterium]
MTARHVIGLTGSIGMGKSTTAAMFAEAGVPVWDADAAVGRLYGEGGAAVASIATLVPEALVDNAIDRSILREHVLADDTLLPRIEAMVHPLVQADRMEFLEAAEADIALCDIPLLFETGAAQAFDTVVVVSAPADVQRERVLARPGMTEAAFEAILARQIPDAEKRARADHIIDTSKGLDDARAQVHTVLNVLRKDL